MAREIDLSSDLVVIAGALFPLVSGAQEVALISPWDNEIGHVYHDSETFEVSSEDDIVCFVSRMAGESDSALAQRLADRFQESIDDA